MISLDKCRRILRLTESELPDAQLKEIRDTLTAFAHTFIDGYLRKKKEEPHADHAASSSPTQPPQKAKETCSYDPKFFVKGRPRQRVKKTRKRTPTDKPSQLEWIFSQTESLQKAPSFLASVAASRIIVKDNGGDLCQVMAPQ